MKKISLLFILFSIALFSQCQMTQDSLGGSVSVSNVNAKSKTISASMEKIFFAKATYPLIKSSKWSGVIPVANVDEKPDVSQQYKLLMEVTTGIKDTVEAKEINAALAEVGRLLNMHIASGIPKTNIDIIVVAHGGILKSFFNNTVYKEKYKVDNPNIVLLNELLAAGVKFVACGQAMAILSIDNLQLLPFVKVALSAQTVLTNYSLKGYVHKNINTDNK